MKKLKMLEPVEAKTYQFVGIFILVKKFIQTLKIKI